MSKFEELLEYDIKPELPNGEMTAFRKKGFCIVEYEGDPSIENIARVYNTAFPRAFYQVMGTDYSSGDIMRHHYDNFWAKPFASLKSEEPVIYPKETYDKKAKVPFMFKLVVPENWFSFSDMNVSYLYPQYSNRYFFPFFKYPFSICTSDVEWYLQHGYTLTKTGKQWDGLDEYQISDNDKKVVFKERFDYYSNKIKKEYYLVQPIPFCRIGNYFVSPLLFNKDVPKEKINEHMQEIWNTVFDKKLFLETIKDLLRLLPRDSIGYHFETKELNPLNLCTYTPYIHDERFKLDTTREISDYAILTGGLGLVNMNMVRKNYEKVENFVEGQGVPECSYLNGMYYLNANWKLESVESYKDKGFTGPIDFMNNFDFSFLGVRLGFKFNSLEETFTEVKGNIGWLKEETPTTVLNDGDQELFEKAYQKGLLEKTDKYFTNPKTKEKQRTYYGFGKKAIRVIPSFYEAKSFYHRLSNGNVYRSDYKKPIWVKVEPIECLINGNYAEFRKILVAGLPIKIKEEDLEKIKDNYRNYGEIIPSSITEIANREEIYDFVSEVFAKEISRVCEVVTYSKVDKNEDDKSNNLTLSRKNN